MTAHEQTDGGEDELARLLDDVEYEVTSERRRMGTSSYTRLGLKPAGPDDEAATELRVVIKAALNREGCKQLRHVLSDLGYEGGERVTIADVLEHDEGDRAASNLDLADLSLARKMLRTEPADFDVGDVLRVTRLRNGGPGSVDTGVVRKVEDNPIHEGERAEITWDGWTYSVLENWGPSRTQHEQNQGLSIGRAGMMGGVYDIEELDPNDADEELQEARENALHAEGVRQAAEDYTVETERTWTTGAEGGAQDHHGLVTVTGPRLDAPVTVHCFNIFDGGWTATVESDDLDDDTQETVIAAVRKNSPITTSVRL